MINSGGNCLGFRVRVWGLGFGVASRKLGTRLGLGFKVLRRGGGVRFRVSRAFG